MATSKSGWRTVGSLRKGKEGNLYIKMAEGVSLNAGDVVQLQDPRKKNLNLVEKGFISSEEAESRNSKIPEYIRYDLVISPPKS